MRRKGRVNFWHVVMFFRQNQKQLTENKEIARIKKATKRVCRLLSPAEAHM